MQLIVRVIQGVGLQISTVFICRKPKGYLPLIPLIVTELVHQVHFQTTDIHTGEDHGAQGDFV